MSPSIPDGLIRTPDSSYTLTTSPRLTPPELPQAAAKSGDIVSRTQLTRHALPLMPHNIEDEFQEFQSGGVNAETQTEDPIPRPFHEILGDEHWEHLLAHEADVTIGELRAEDIRNLIPTLDRSGKKSNAKIDEYLGKTAGKAVIDGIQTFNPTQELMDAVIELRKSILEWSTDPHGNTIHFTQIGYQRSKKSKPLTEKFKKEEAYECVLLAKATDQHHLEQRFVKAYNNHQTMLPTRGTPLRAYGPTLAKVHSAIEKHYGVKHDLPSYLDDGYLPTKYDHTQFSPFQIQSHELESALIRAYRSTFRHWNE